MNHVLGRKNQKEERNIWLAVDNFKLAEKRYIWINNTTK